MEPCAHSPALWESVAPTAWQIKRGRISLFPEGLGELAQSLHYHRQRPFLNRALGLENLNQNQSKTLLWTSPRSLSPGRRAPFPQLLEKPC